MGFSFTRNDTLFFGIELPTDAIYKLPSLGFKHLPANHGFTSKLLFIPDKARVRVEAAAKALPDPLVPRVKGVHPPEAFKNVPPTPASSAAQASPAAQASQTPKASPSKAPPVMPTEPKAQPPMRPSQNEASL